jgi:hypothetical protein
MTVNEIHEEKNTFTVDVNIPGQSMDCPCVSPTIQARIKEYIYCRILYGLPNDMAWKVISFPMSRSSITAANSLPKRF